MGTECGPQAGPEVSPPFFLQKPGQTFWTLCPPPTSPLDLDTHVGPGCFLLWGVEVGSGLSHPVAAAHLEPWHSWGAGRTWGADGRALLENRVVRALQTARHLTEFCTQGPRDGPLR